ncbi:MAG TPA: hypothetical protein VFL49_07975 [Pseudolabrys sp.]|nr:hypothetical protein [Pseudolabrys sp.]
MTYFIAAQQNAKASIYESPQGYSDASRTGCRLAEDGDAARPIPDFHDRIDGSFQDFTGFQQSIGVVGALTRLGGRNVVALKQMEPIAGGHGPLPVIRFSEAELQECSTTGVKDAIG